MLGPTRKLPPVVFGLSARLLVMTIAFVMLSEVLIYVPSIANFRKTYLAERIAAAQLATLALEATPDFMVGEELNIALLRHAETHAVILHRPGRLRVMLVTESPPPPDLTVDLRQATVTQLIADAMATLFQRSNRVLRVLGDSTLDFGVVVETHIDEEPMRVAMQDYSERILGLSIVISLITASLVFLSLQWLTVRPMRRLIDSIAAFREAPEDARRVLRPGRRTDEIGVAQRELANMQEALRSALAQQARLAALGSAVTKINHDLSNILSTVRLLSDRLADSTDPNVKKLAPNLLGAVDRAVALCGQTLDFARDQPPQPKMRRFALRPLIDDVGQVVALLTANRSQWQNIVHRDVEVEADAEQLFRVLVNLGRNAAEAGASSVQVRTRLIPGKLVVEVRDDGPGVPAKARNKLFQPFAGSARPGGTGLGLAIARDLMRAHGGDIELAESSSKGTVFHLALPVDEAA